MAMSELEKVRSVFVGMNSGDVNMATEYLDAQRFLQHDPSVPDGVSGLKTFTSQSSREENQVTIVRAIQDGPYVVVQLAGKLPEKGVVFEVFRFDGGLVVEHWAFATTAAEKNASGHTQIDGPTEPSHHAETESNRRALRAYYETFHIHGDHRQPENYFADDLMIRHEPGVRDGVAEFLKDVEELMKHRTIDRIKLLIVEGDFGFIAAEGTHENKPCVYIDLYRLQGEKIVEHWGFPEMVPPEESRRNKNGVL